MLTQVRNIARSIIPVGLRRRIKDALGLPRIMHGDFGVLGRIGNVPEPHIVLDCGAFEGWFSECWLQFNPTAKIVAFEPAAKAFQGVLLPRFGNRTDIVLVQAACGSSNQDLKLHTSQFAAANSVLDLRQDSGLDISVNGNEIVSQIRIDDYAKAVGIDQIKLVKVDVQGFEMELLRGMERILDRVEYIYIESGIHPVYSGGYDFCDVFRYLSQRGFVLLDIKATTLGTRYLRECDMLFQRNDDSVARNAVEG